MCKSQITLIPTKEANGQINHAMEGYRQENHSKRYILKLKAYDQRWPNMRPAMTMRDKAVYRQIAA